MELSEILGTVARTFGVFVFILAILRLSGKRTMGNFTPFDLLAAMMLAEVTEEIVFGNVHPVKGVAAILSIAAAQQINSWLCYKNKTIDKILEGEPTIIVKDGEMQRRGMRQERMNEDEVMSELRLSGIDDLNEVRLALVEPDGRVSVIRHNWAKELQKKDRSASASVQRVERKDEGSRHSDTTRTVEDAQ
jgi:uncharacterized membrane protein YcaP (DUF421 family)